MPIFGLKSRKSHSSVISSVSKHEAPPHSATNNLEAADVVGDTPDFGPVAHTRRATNNTADSSSSSLRSRNSTSMKKFFGSTRRKGSHSIDAAAHSNTAAAAGAKSSDYFGSSNTKRASQISLVNKPSVASSTSPPVITPGAIAPSLSSPTGATGSFAEAVGAGVSGGLASPSSPTGAPRPSELFAGKGVQWNQIDLTSRDLTKPTDAAATSVDMQKFLKERRQWIPTFKDSHDTDDNAVNLPKSLDQFSFGDAPDVAKSSAGLKSLKDLEDTHKRKAALLDKTPLATTANGTIFEEAAAATTLTSPSAIAGPSTAQSLPPPPAPPSRNQSFRTSAFSASNDASTRKSNSISRKPAPPLATTTDTVGTAAAAASRDIPQRRSSVRKHLSELAGPAATTTTEASETAAPASESAAAAATDKPSQEAEPPQSTNGRVEQIKEQAAAAEAAPTSSTANGSVRASIDTAGFVTPAESQTHDNQSAAAERLRDAQNASTQPASLPAADASHDSAATAAPVSPLHTDTPPRPPKNGQRTPSRQSSKEPISSSPNKPPSSTVAEIKEHIAQAAPSLQNIVPGTGAATTPAAQQ